MITTDEYLDHCDRALDGFAEAVRALGDDLVNARLDVPGSNSAYAVVAHVVGVMAYWGSTVNRGLPVPRDRDAEFTARGTVDEALALLDAGRARLHDDARAARPGEAPVSPPPDDDPDMPWSQGEVLLHVFEELTPHLGQVEVTRDVLLARAA